MSVRQSGLDGTAAGSLTRAIVEQTRGLSLSKPGTLAPTPALSLRLRGLSLSKPRPLAPAAR